jgi:hypothetical protein
MGFGTAGDILRLFSFLLALTAGADLPLAETLLQVMREAAPKGAGFPGHTAGNPPGILTPRRQACYHQYSPSPFLVHRPTTALMAAGG